MGQIQQNFDRDELDWIFPNTTKFLSGLTRLNGLNLGQGQLGQISTEVDYNEFGQILVGVDSEECDKILVMADSIEYSQTSHEVDSAYCN